MHMVLHPHNQIEGMVDIGIPVVYSGLHALFVRSQSSSGFILLSDAKGDCCSSVLAKFYGVVTSRPKYAAAKVNDTVLAIHIIP